MSNKIALDMIPSENFETIELLYNSIGEESNIVFSELRVLLTFAKSNTRDRIELLENMKTSVRNEEYLRITLLQYYNMELALLDSYGPKNSPMIDKNIDRYEDFKNEYRIYKIKELSKILLLSNDETEKRETHFAIIDLLEKR